MRRLAIIIFLLMPITAVALPLFMLGGGLVTKFYAPFTTSGITPAAVASWPSAAGLAPTYAWYGDDPTGSQGKTTGTYIATGSPTTGIDTPFCPAGGFSDVSGCMQAVRFSGAGQYYTADSATTMQTTNNTDFTLCYIAKVDATVAGNVAVVGTAASGSVGDPGFIAYYNYATKTYRTHIQGTDAGSYNNSVVASAGAYMIHCNVFDVDTNSIPYSSGIVGTPVAIAAVAIGSTNAVKIGEDYGIGVTSWLGDIVAVFMWPTTALSAGQVKTFTHYFMGILDTKGSVATFTNTGPTSCWVDGLIEYYSDDFAKIGCEIPPGLPGAGYPASGYMSSLTQTNSILYSRALDTGWTATGVNVTEPGTNTPFRDSRATVKIIDDDGASIEEVHQTMAWAAANTGDKLQICIYAGADSAQSVDIQIAEATGCGGSTTNFASANVTATWGYVGPTLGGWTHTVADGACTDYTLTICPTSDCTNVALQGHGYYLVQVFKSITYCPANYIETTTAAVTQGADILTYSIASSGIVDGAGAFVGNVQTLFDWTPAMADLPMGTYPIIYDDNSESNRLTFLQQSDEEMRVYWDPGAATADSAVQTFTPGTTWVEYEYTGNYDSDSYILKADDVAIITNTAAKTSPTGVTTMRIGQSRANNSQGPGGAWIKELKVRK